MATKSGVIKIETTTGRPAAFPTSSTIAAAPLATPFGSSQPWVVGGVFSGSSVIRVPNGSAGEFFTVTVRISLTTWPQTVTLIPSDSVIALPAVSLATQPVGILVGAPYVALVWGSGSATTSAIASPQASMVLQPGRSYIGPALYIAYDVLLLTTQINSTNLPILVQATLVGQRAPA